MPKPEVGQNFLTFGLIQAVLALKYAFPHQGGPENSKPLEVSRCHKHFITAAATAAAAGAAAAQ